MRNMAFRSFTWPQNPHTYRVECKREPMYGVDSNGGYGYIGMGPVVRSVTGSGAFSGELAMDSFQELEALCMGGNAGTLIPPEGENITAFLTELVMELDARPQYVAYRFVFREADENGGIPE